MGGSGRSLKLAPRLDTLGGRRLPVAYVDTPQRVPYIERDGNVLVIDYYALEALLR